MDDDNLLGALKAFTDGITEAGWWLNDKQVSFGEPVQLTWGKIDKAAKGQYPDGFVIYDVYLSIESVTS
jgi:Holliday junction resolvase RusA-like endonuclease